MIASKRERIVGLLTAAVLAALALDKLIYTPLNDRAADLEVRLAQTGGEMQLAETLFSNRRSMNENWTAMVTGGIRSDVTDAESQTVNALRDWMLEAGVTPGALKLERTETRDQFRVVYVGTTCTGSLRQISEVLWRVQTTQMPMRVSMMQISALKPGTDELRLQLTVSTLALAPPPDPAKAPGGRGRAGQSVASAAGAAGFGREVSR